MSKVKEEEQPHNQVAVVEKTQSERFTEMVLKEFSSNVGNIQLGEYHKKLCRSYFIKIDMSLKETESKRLLKEERYREPLAYTWANVNMPKLALDVVAYTSVGIDPLLSNMVNMIPYKNKSTNKFDFGFILGYDGIKTKAMKYALDPPDRVIVELVYKNDIYKPIKKDANNDVEKYHFEIVSPFDRGPLVGGFYYYAYKNEPEKNKLKSMSVADIEKRKPAYASAEFWGGEKDKWEGGKKVGKEKVEGWYDEMCEKTIKRAAYGAITLDSEKIDDSFNAIVTKERELLDDRVKTEINQNANKTPLSIIDTINSTMDDANKKSLSISEEEVYTQHEVIDESPKTKEVQTEKSGELTEKEKAEISKEESDLFSGKKDGPGF